LRCADQCLLQLLSTLLLRQPLGLGCCLRCLAVRYLLLEAPGVGLCEANDGKRGDVHRAFILDHVAIKVLYKSALQRGHRVEGPIGKFSAQLRRGRGRRHGTLGKKGQLAQHRGLAGEVVGGGLEEFAERLV